MYQRLPVFPISGVLLSPPTADDYELEAMLLRQEAASRERRHEKCWHLYEKAFAFAKLARRKRWQEETCRAVAA